MAGVDRPAEGRLGLVVAALHGQHAAEVERGPRRPLRRPRLHRPQEPFRLGQVAALHHDGGEVHHRHGRDLAVVAFRGLAVGALGAGQVAPALQQLTQVVGDLGGRPPFW
jgi:hypothetical protein